MKAMIVGGGARENAMSDALIAGGAEVYAFMPAENPGIKKAAKAFAVGSMSDPESAARFAKNHNVEFAVIGPEAPLAAGMVDELEKGSIPCIGPRKELARLETSKGFTRNLLRKYDINASPRFKVFDKNSEDGIAGFLDETPDFVVKPDGLTGGKGVKLYGEHLKSREDALAYCDRVLESGPVVIEEKLEGEEFSLQTLTDGEDFLHFPPVQDHKRAFEGDRGPNTGGMGSYSDSNLLLPFLTEDDVKAASKITERVAAALKEETGSYRGVMYGGFMKTAGGIMLLEYNARFGDPEAMNALPLLNTNFAGICKAVVEERLGSIRTEFMKKATVCKYVVPRGYPDSPARGKIKVPEEGVLTYYASVEEKEDGIHMTGSRAVAFVGMGGSIDEAEEIAEDAASKVEGDTFHRRDIGTKELIQKRVEHIRRMRGVGA